MSGREQEIRDPNTTPGAATSNPQYDEELSDSLYELRRKTARERIRDVFKGIRQEAELAFKFPLRYIESRINRIQTEIWKRGPGILAMMQFSRDYSDTPLERQSELPPLPTKADRERLILETEQLTTRKDQAKNDVNHHFAKDTSWETDPISMLRCLYPYFTKNPRVAEEIYGSLMDRTLSEASIFLEMQRHGFGRFLKEVVLDTGRGLLKAGRTRIALVNGRFFMPTANINAVGDSHEVRRVVRYRYEIPTPQDVLVDIALENFLQGIFNVFPHEFTHQVTPGHDYQEIKEALASSSEFPPLDTATLSTLYTHFKKEGGYQELNITNLEYIYQFIRDLQARGVDIDTIHRTYLFDMVRDEDGTMWVRSFLDDSNTPLQEFITTSLANLGVTRENIADIREHQRLKVERDKAYFLAHFWELTRGHITKKI